MVLEQIFKITWIERKEHAFFLGFFYSLIGFFSALLIFPNNTGLMSVAFTSILLIPSLAALLKLEENAEIREKKFSLRLLFKDHKDIFKVYIFMFLGIFFAYCLITMFLPQMSIDKIFAPHLKSAGLTGFAVYENPLTGIILNNLVVFVVCFLLSLIYGAGSVIFLTWNASVWGVVFTYFVIQSAQGTQNLFVEFGRNILPFLPHMSTEALAFISAAIVGGVVSKAVLREELFSKKFHHIITDAMILLCLGMVLVIIGGIIEVKLYFLLAGLL